MTSKATNAIVNNTPTLHVELDNNGNIIAVYPNTVIHEPVSMSLAQWFALSFLASITALAIYIAVTM